MRTIPALLASAVFLASLVCFPVDGSGASDPARSAGIPRHPAWDGRLGGETIETAIEIPALFEDTGATCDNVNDYDAVCPYDGSTSPDVVYRHTPGSFHTWITVDLCSSEYDTKVYIYQAPDFVTPVACNDDADCGYSGWQSRIDSCPVVPGIDYYIVIDGYEGDCGTYHLSFECGGVGLACPPGALKEGEPECTDGYQDAFNSGCDGPGPFRHVDPQNEGCAVVCGRACAFQGSGILQADTDWYDMTAIGGPLRAAIKAEFAVQMLLVYGTDCQNLLFDVIEVPAWQEGELVRRYNPGADAWVSVLPAVDQRLPESDYLLTICGIGAGVSSAPDDGPRTPDGSSSSGSTWGRLKARYSTTR